VRPAATIFNSKGFSNMDFVINVIKHGVRGVVLPTPTTPQVKKVNIETTFLSTVEEGAEASE
jgi:hypothetical protein